ncbi:MAG: thiamine pyrophosphate-binding protein [Chloroflexota bacterium]|nr:thiamine pyrophosphate-binding protein [Chloroflexota bacterium]
MKLTGAQIIVEYLAKEGVPLAAGIPGHGIWSVVDALAGAQDRIRTVQVMHEQSAVHLADGYYRASGQPCAAFTSIGPGATNTAIGVATAYVDSTAVLLLTGAPHTYMRGRGVLQEIERTHWANFPRMMEPIVKRHWTPAGAAQLPYVLQRAFNAMLSGRPGPVLLDLPMDVQAEAADVALPEPAARRPRGGPRPDAQMVERAARLLASAQRPVIVAGGGVITAEASRELVALAEHIGAAVVTTWMGKGSIPEDHALNAWGIGDTASTCGNTLCARADVLLAVGCRFTDWTASSYRKGVTFAIPTARLIQLDIEPQEIGKDYPCEVPLLGDAKAGLADLLAALRDSAPGRELKGTPYFDEIQREKQRWDALQAPKRESDAVPMTQQRAVTELRAALDRDAIVTSGAGIPQGIVRQDFPVYAPRTHITSGGFSSMGFTVPAAIGAKLAQPQRQVAGVAGDGDFMQTMQEMATAAMLDLPVLFVVLNNAGWISIRGGQMATFGRHFATEFARKDGSAYTPDFAAAARAFGLHAERIDQPQDLRPAVARALATHGPALVEVTVARSAPEASLTKTGWWDVPVPEYLPERRAQYERERAEEQL